MTNILNVVLKIVVGDLQHVIMIIWSFCRLSPAWSVTRLRWPVCIRPSSSGARGRWACCGPSARSALPWSRWSFSSSRRGWAHESCTTEGVRFLRPGRWASLRSAWRRIGPSQNAVGLFTLWPHSLPSSLPLCWSACLSSWCGSAWAACVCSDSATQQPSIRSVLGCSSQQVRLFHWSLTKAAFNWSKIQYLNCIILKYFLLF